MVHLTLRAGTVKNGEYCYDREPGLPLFCHFLKKMKPENKERIVFSILAYGDMSRFDSIIADLEASGVKSRAVKFQSEYLEKSIWAANQDFEYTAKIDDDVFLSNHALDYVIENIGALDDPSIVAISPVITNGIPTSEMFLEQFATEEQKQEIYSMFLQTRFSPLWGVDYTFLNRHTVDAKEWKPEEFYASVYSIRHFYKGIHPLRINAEAQLAMNQIVMNGADRFFAEQEFALTYNNYPYLCNNLFFMRTDVMRKIFQDRSLWCDPFDEVPISEYKQRNNFKWLFVKNGWCQHFAWNTVSGNEVVRQTELPFVEELKRKVFLNDFAELK